jgi:CHASE2 domain-containing sensor protein
MMEPAGIWKALLSVCHKATRPVVRKGWLHWLRFALLLAAGSYVGHVLSESDRFTDWRYELYQWQVRWQRRGPVYPKYTALVLLNDDDYWSEEYQARAPLKRDKLAALLDKLNAAGVNTVAFDVFLESPRPENPNYDFPDYRAEDEAFFASVKRMCDAGRHVVLATEYTNVEEPRGEKPSIYFSRLPALPCVSRGHIDFPNDMRKIPGMMKLQDGSYLDSFSLAMTKIADPIAYESLVKDEDKGYRFGQFLTRKDFSTRDGRQFIFNGVSVEHMDLNRLRQAVADKTVIVGGNWHSKSYGVGDEVDVWASPGGDESGAMLHANYVEAMRDPDSTFTPISDRAAELIEWSLAFALALLGSLEVHAGWKWGGFVLSCVFSVVLCYVLLQNLGFFLDFAVPMVVIVLHTMAEEVLEMRRELHHAKHLLQKEKAHETR